MSPFNVLQRSPASTCKLDVDALALGTENERVLARIVAEETEAERNRQRGTASDFEISSGGLLGYLEGKTIRYVDTLQWDFFFAIEDVFQKCAGRAKLPAHEVVEYVLRNCKPNNWLAIRYLWAYLLERHFGKIASTAKVFELVKVEKEHEFKLAEARKNAFRERGQAGADKAHRGNREARAWVRAAWQKNRGDYKGNKSDFARTYVTLVLKERGVKITAKQMCEVWLKDTPPATKQAG